LVVLALAAGATLLAAPVVVKLSTIAVPGTIWDTALAQMGADWRKATDGRVTLKVTNGQGSESKIIKAMSMGANLVDAARPPMASLRSTGVQRGILFSRTPRRCSCAPS
jgi:TRAP-type C4-dicarboxylate transport system substrate-binding protein